MDEASSKFVDQLVQGKLLDEKLRRVHHFPEGGLTADPADLFHDFGAHRLRALPETTETADGYRFASPVPSEHRENDSCEVVVHSCPSPRACLVFQHGLFEDNRTIYDFLFKGLREKGFEIHLSALPYHYHRKPAASLFGGEYFWSAHYQRTRAAFRQAVYELDVVERLASRRSGLPTYVAGFSMGGCVALLLASLRSDLAGVAAINPATTLSGIVWDSPLCSTIKADYQAAGYTVEDLKTAFASFEPQGATSVALPLDRLLLVYALYDQVTSLGQYQTLVAGWGLPNALELKAGHLNTLRIPRLAGDLAHFFDTLPEPNP
jgi:pimeloyl-ACP methyl ester carboxylesterase